MKNNYCITKLQARYEKVMILKSVIKDLEELKN